MIFILLLVSGFAYPQEQIVETLDEIDTEDEDMILTREEYPGVFLYIGVGLPIYYNLPDFAQSEFDQFESNPGIDQRSGFQFEFGFYTTVKSDYINGLFGLMIVNLTNIRIQGDNSDDWASFTYGAPYLTLSYMHFLSKTRNEGFYLRGDFSLMPDLVVDNKFSDVRTKKDGLAITTGFGYAIRPKSWESRILFYYNHHHMFYKDGQGSLGAIGIAWLISPAVFAN